MWFPCLTMRALNKLARPKAWRINERICLMAWALLGIAGILEIAFAFCMKWSEGFTRLIPALFTVATGLSSVFLLSLSLRTLPVGTGYAVWTGIGAAGTAILGMAYWAIRCADEDTLHCSHSGRRDRTQAGLGKLTMIAGRWRRAGVWDQIMDVLARAS